MTTNRERIERLEARVAQLERAYNDHYPTVTSLEGLPDGTIVANENHTFHIVNHEEPHELYSHEPAGQCEQIESTNPNPQHDKWTIIYQPTTGQDTAQ